VIKWNCTDDIHTALVFLQRRRQLNVFTIVARKHVIEISVWLFLLCACVVFVSAGKHRGIYRWSSFWKSWWSAHQVIWKLSILFNVTLFQQYSTFVNIFVMLCLLRKFETLYSILSVTAWFFRQKIFVPYLQTHYCSCNISRAVTFDYFLCGINEDINRPIKWKFN
jgi:hypothetical protein